IPVKIFPPELKTFFTLVHALVKVFLNQSGIPLKALVIPFFILVNREVTPFLIVFVTLESLDHKFSKVDTAVERMLDTLFETIVFIFVQPLEREVPRFDVVVEMVFPIFSNILSPSDFKELHFLDTSSTKSDAFVTAAVFDIAIASEIVV